MQQRQQQQQRQQLLKQQRQIESSAPTILHILLCKQLRCRLLSPYFTFATIAIAQLFVVAAQAGQSLQVLQQSDLHLCGLQQEL